MNITSFLVFTAIGGGAGWLVGTVIKSWGCGVIGNILIGGISGGASGYLYGLPLVGGGLVGSMVVAAIGAGSLLWGVGCYRNDKESSSYFKGDELWIRRKPLNRR
jgi:hypothetical protein